MRARPNKASFALIVFALASFATVPAFAEEADAAKSKLVTVSSGPLSPNVPAGNMTCYFTNAGEDPIKISAAKIIDRNGEAVTLGFSGCTKSLAPHAACAIGWDIAGAPPYRCSAKVDDARDLRGRLEFRLNGETVAATAFR